MYRYLDLLVVRNQSGDPNIGIWKQDKIIFHSKGCLGDFFPHKDWIHHEKLQFIIPDGESIWKV